MEKNKESKLDLENNSRDKTCETQLLINTEINC